MKVKKKKKEDFKEFRNNEKSAYKTFKIPLKTILLNRDTTQPVINHLVFEMNDLVIHTYQFIRLYVLDKYTKNQPLPNIDETFILYCIKTLGSRDNRGKKGKDTELLEVLDAFYKTEYQPLLNHEKTNLKNTTFLLPYLATQIHTSLHNNIQEHFIQHFLRFINKTTNQITEDKSILFQFKNKCLSLEETDIIFDDWKNIHLPNILPTEIKKSIHYDIKVRPFEYLKGMLYMNSILEKQESKLFQPLPLRNNIIPKHIILDTASIINLFCPEKDKDGNKTKKGELLSSVKENQNEVWCNFLDMKNRIFKNKHYQFHNQIQTDGISCCLLFIRKDLKDKKWGSRVPVLQEQDFHTIEDLSKEQLDTLKDRNIVGCDPGKHSLVYMIDKKGKKLEYTASQRKIESYGKRNQRILLQEKKKHKIIEKETRLSIQNSKSVNYDKFKMYLVEKYKLNKETTDFYKKEVWRKMKFRQYSYGKKSIDTFLNKIKETFGENILIGYGNWSRSSQMKYTMPTMNKGLRKLIHKKYDTITINEFYTSQKCCECRKDLKHYKDKNGGEIYRLFTCSNCVSCENKNIVFRTRDKNSAINILNLTECWIHNQTRPVEFQFQASSFTCGNKNAGLSKTIGVKKQPRKSKHAC
uniref:Transposase n=1 Tax=viral metagenome TaxID=1070528 RepID=A0A6C0HQR7_9ZZZZ